MVFQTVKDALPDEGVLQLTGVPLDRFALGTTNLVHRREPGVMYIVAAEHAIRPTADGYPFPELPLRQLGTLVGVSVEFPRQLYYLRVLRLGGALVVYS